MQNNTDLQNCNQEKIHLIGSIQSYGYLLVLDPAHEKILQASENIKQLLNVHAKDIIGTSLDDHFSFAFLDYFNQVRQHGPQEDAHSVHFELKDQNFVLNTHHSPEGFWILEIEPYRKEQEAHYGLYAEMVQNLLPELEAQQKQEQLFETVLKRLQKILNTDRLMLYRFDHQNNGEVISELAKDGKERFKGLKFPASDIPDQARQMYLNTALRGIWDVDDKPVLVYPAIRPSDNKALDLSRSFLRSLSPVHIEYLKNMKVKASFSITLKVKNRLWGMIIGHQNSQPLLLSIHQRRACIFAGKLLAQKIASHEENQKLHGYKTRLKVLSKMMLGLSQLGYLQTILQENRPELLQAFAADDCLLCLEVKKLEGWQKALVKSLTQKGDKIFSSRELAKDFPEIADTPELPAGMLALQISEKLNEYLLIFRKAENQTVTWGGKPTAGEKSLRPRKSFEQWTEKSESKSYHWQDDELLFAEELRIMLISNRIAQQRMTAQKVDDYIMRLSERNNELLEQNRQLRHDTRKLKQDLSESTLKLKVAAENKRAVPLHTLSKKQGHE